MDRGSSVAPRPRGRIHRQLDRLSLGSCGLLLLVPLCGCGGRQQADQAPAKQPASNASAPQPSAGDYVSFPAAGIKLVRPEGFEDATTFEGFQQESTGSSVLAVKLPAPYAEATRGFTTARMKTRGMNLLDKQQVDFGGQQGLLMEVTQRMPLMQPAQPSSTSRRRLPRP